MAIGSAGTYDVNAPTMYVPVATVAEHWDGHAWTIEPTPSPGGATSSSLAGVSCALPSDCVAVGSWVTGDGATVPLIEHWDGSAWSIQPTPGQTGALSGISCVAIDNCFAVGQAGSAALVERWNGSGWTIDPTASHPGALSGVSCVAAVGCVAVGSSGGASLVERWDGATWTSGSAQDPGNGLQSNLTGVSCSSATACTGVGYTTAPVGRTDEPLVERWDGTDWVIQPTPSAAEPARLDGVWCSSTNVCTAVGSLAIESGMNGFVPEGPIAEAWDGTRWTMQPTAQQDQFQSLLAAVWCASADQCIADGYDTNQTLVEAYAGDPGTGQPFSSPPYASTGTPTTRALTRARVRGRVRTVGGQLRFTFTCPRKARQPCRGRATATAIERLSMGARRITGVAAGTSGTVRSRSVVVAERTIVARPGHSTEIAMTLNPTGRWLRSRFGSLPATVRVTAIAAGSAVTIRTAKVTFRR